MTKEELIYMLEIQNACEDWIDELKKDPRTPEEIWNNPQVPDKDYRYPIYWPVWGPTGRYMAKIEKSLSIEQYRDIQSIPWQTVEEILKTDCLLYYACPEYLKEINWPLW